MVALDGAADQSKRHDIQLQPRCVGRNRFSNSQHGSAASPPIMPATKLGSDTLKTVFHNSPAIQLAASIATMVSSRRCQIGNIGRIASFLFFAVLNYLRSRGCFQALQRRMMLAALGALRPTLQARQLPVPTPCAARWPRRFFRTHGSCRQSRAGGGCGAQSQLRRQAHECQCQPGRGPLPVAFRRESLGATCHHDEPPVEDVSNRNTCE